MITEIGLVAGDIWIYLDRHGKKGTLEDIVNELNKNREIVLMSVGWLAREGHIVLDGDGPNYTIKLIG